VMAAASSALLRSRTLTSTRLSVSEAIVGSRLSKDCDGMLPLNM
jgi:hypothetical protein